MEQSTIDRLIINKPYEEPAEHWRYNRETRKFSREPGRRPIGLPDCVGGFQDLRRPGHVR